VSSSKCFFDHLLRFIRPLRPYSANPYRRVTAAIASREGEQTVYNFEVDANHDYFVGKTGLLVHNCGLGQGSIFSHFTDAEGVQGITGLEGLAPGETAIVDELTFGMGENSFLAESNGDIFVTDLSADASSSALDQIGVFGERQAYTIQMSQETLLQNGVRAVQARPGIFTIPGGTTLQGVFNVIRIF
jgi:hypothetical protein